MVCCLLGPLGPGVEIFNNLLLWTYLSASDGCTVSPRKDSRHRPLCSIEEKRAKTGFTKTMTGRGEGYPPLPPPLFKMFVLLWKYTMREYTGEVYMLSPSFNLYVFCSLTCEGSYPDNGGEPVAEAAGAAARHKDHPPRLCLWCI